MYLPFCSTTLCHFLGNCIIPSSQNFLSFEKMELKFFSLREFCKDWNKKKSEGATSGEYHGWIRTSQPRFNTSSWSSKKHAVLHHPDRRLWIFCSLISDMFQSELFSVGLIGNSTCWNESFGFPEGVHNRRLPCNPITYNITFFGWRLAFRVVGRGSFHLPHGLFCSTLLYNIHFS